MTKATVKWFNQRKGFGFVAPDDGSPDAFLHISVVERAGYASLPDGTIIDCEIVPGNKGPQVETIESATMAGPGPGGETIEGTVKWFNADKGFGFIQREDGGKDVFVHRTALERSGLRHLPDGQRVRVDVRMGQKGVEADSIEVI